MLHVQNVSKLNRQTTFFLPWMDPIIQGSKETGAQLKTDFR